MTLRGIGQVLLAMQLLVLVPSLATAQKKSYRHLNFTPQINTGLLSSRANEAAGITLTKVPRSMFLEGDAKKTRQLTWQPSDLACVLRYDTVPGNGDIANNYPNTLQSRGTGSLTVNAGDERLAAGVYYCIIVAENDPSLTSVEFRIIVQATSTPKIVSPLGSVSLQQGAPLFRWDPVVGVPYYFLFLSEGPISIERNEEDEIVGLGGLNLIWQVITAKAFLRYGEPDPGGNFPSIHIPPLIPGIEYNWLVLNSYGPNPDFISSEVAPVAPSFFDVTRPELGQKPALERPRAGTTVASDDIEFSWQPVNGASRYRLFLYEETNFQDNLVRYILWSQVTSETNILFQAKNLLVNAKYAWRVIAEADGRISASELSEFFYDGTAGWVEFYVFATEGDLSRVSIDIHNPVDGSVLLPAVTDTLGLALLPLPQGDYTFTASRQDFQTTASKSFSVQDGDTTKVSFAMERAMNTVSGRIVDKEGNGIFNAIVEASAPDFTRIEYTDVNGYFIHALDPGDWKIRARKQGFAASEYVDVLLQGGEAINLGNITMDAATNAITGKVTFASDGRAFQGALVSAQKDNIVYETITNGQGGFRFDLGPGTWSISIAAQGFFATPTEYTFQLTDSIQAEASFQLFEGGLVYGAVTFEGLPVESAEVRAFDLSDQNTIQSVLTNTHGHFTMGLPNGDYEISVTKHGFLTERREISVRSGQTQVEDFALSQAGTVQGRVRNLETALPVAGAKVFAIADTTLLTVTDSNGNYSLSLPPDMPFELDVTFPGFTSSNTVTVVATAGEVLTGQDFFLKALSGIVRGRVTDGFSALAGVRVYLPVLELEMLTDTQGRFEFEIPPDTYSVEFTKSCHFRHFETVELIAGTTVDLDIVLRPLSSEILGKVLDEFGSPLETAIIAATAITSDTTFTSYSNEDGDYRLCVSSGTLRVRASKAGYSEADTFLVVNENDLHTGVNFVLQEHFAQISGTIRDTSGAPIAEAVVDLKNDTQHHLTQTTEQGFYKFTRVIPGESRLGVSKKGLYAKAETTLLEPSEAAERDFVMYPADGFIQGRTFDARDGSTVAGVEISAQFDFDSEFVPSTTSDSVGFFGLENLPVVPGRGFRVFAFKEGFFLPAPALNVPSKADGVHFYLVSKIGEISGTIEDFDSAAPVADARVEAINNVGGRSIAFSDTSGNFRLTNLIPTDFYNVSVARAGYFSGGQKNVAAGDTSVAIRLLRKYGFIKGRIVSIESGTGLGNIPIHAVPLGPEGQFTETNTNASGDFLMRAAPGFYQVEPALSHYRSEPGFEQHEIAELDTVSGIEFAIEHQTVSTIFVKRVDQTERPSISNKLRHCYEASAVDVQNRNVNIGHPNWSLDVSSKAASIDEDGCVDLSPTYFGELTINASDPVSGIEGNLQVEVFAQIDSTTQITLFNDRGLALQIPRIAVVTRNDLLVSQIPVAPAKKGRSRLFTSDRSFVLKPAGLAFNNPAKLTLPPPPNNEGQEHFIALWNSERSEWRLLATVDQSDRLEATIIETGEYVALALSKPLTIENLSLLPNPFSPFIESDGAPGLSIRFDLTSSAAPTPLLSVKIYNLEGNLVRLLHDQTPFPRGNILVNWDGKTDDGLLARNGRYLVQVIAEDPSDRKDEMRSVVLIK